MKENGHAGNTKPPIGRGPNANQEIGVPGGPPGWHSRGYLPHFDDGEVIQHVTFHLADSLAKDVLDRMAAELKTLPVKRQEVERRKKIEAWMDAGHGSCVLQNPVIAEMVQNALLFFDGQRYRILAWVVMPNHVHVLFQPINAWTIAKIVGSWKKFTARRICDRRRNTEAANAFANAKRAVCEIATAIQEDGPLAAAVWHREYWDRYMRDEDHFQQAVEYIHQNPVKANLVAKAEEWRWSSAFPGNAKLPKSEGEEANQEIGVPGVPGKKA
jgi:putative transposase